MESPGVIGPSADSCRSKRERAKERPEFPNGEARMSLLFENQGGQLFGDGLNLIAGDLI